MTSRTIIGYGNRCDEATLAGGSWMTTLPLANLQNRLIAKVARSNGTTKAATQFDIDLGRARKIGVLALVGHNLTDQAGAVREPQHDRAVHTARREFDLALQLIQCSEDRVEVLRILVDSKVEDHFATNELGLDAHDVDVPA
jgi:hypothetical protein